MYSVSQLLAFVCDLIRQPEYWILDHESQEERKEGWITRLFRLSDGPVAASPSSKSVPKGNKAKDKVKAKANKKVPAGQAKAELRVIWHVQRYVLANVVSSQGASGKNGSKNASDDDKMTDANLTCRHFLKFNWNFARACQAKECQDPQVAAG